MNIRKWMLFSIYRLRGQRLGTYYYRYLNEFYTGIAPDTTRNLLIKLFQHCEQNVPYFAKLMKEIGGGYENDPVEYITHLPILTKNNIRNNFDELKSLDITQRRWYLNSSSGSTGIPVQLIQDRDYASQAGAVKLLFSKLVGKEIGELEVRLWGNLHDIASSDEGWRARLITILENAIFINSFMMSPTRMRECINIINRSKPKLIVAYADSIYQIARFAERERLEVLPQFAIMTSAFQLYPFMRAKIEEIFRCKVFNRYGSREVGDIACEIPGHDGLWVAPWGNYLEIVDSEYNRVPDGTEGEILVTSLRNYAMPLIRYRIGDRGIISSPSNKFNVNHQILKDVTGRTIDLFRTHDGTIINPSFFMANVFSRNWIAQYQVIQKDYFNIIYKIVKITQPPEQELQDIIALTKKAMGDSCEVSFDFVESIPPTRSGKYRYLITDVGENM